MRPRTRAAIVGILTGLTVMGLLVGGCVALNKWLDPFDDQPFDPAVWSGAESHNERGAMARDALRYLVVGSSRDRVQELLGTPDYPFVDAFHSGTGYVDGFGNPLLHPETWAYDLGCHSGLGRYSFDSAFLYVHFGRDGRVAAAEITGG